MTRLPQIKRRQRKTFPYWPVAFVVALVAIGLVTLTQQQASQAIDAPLGPTLPVFGQQTLLPTPTSVIAGVGAVEIPGTPTQTPISPPALQVGPTAVGDPQCGGPRQLIILVIGTDQADGYNRGLADAIRVVRVDFVEPSVSIMAFPRDLWVVLPGLEGRGSLEEYFGTVTTADGSVLQGDYARINVAYFYGNLYDIPGGGQTMLAQTLYTNFGLAVDNYVVMNMHVFEDVVDAIGGIDVDVPKELNDTEKGWYFAAGWQHLDGENALRYARIRHTDSDFGRINRQTQVLLAVRDKIIQPEVMPNVASVASTFLDDLLTDLSRGEISSLICLASQVPPENIRTYSITRDMVTPVRTSKGASVLLPNFYSIGGLIYEFLYGPSS